MCFVKIFLPFIVLLQFTNVSFAVEAEKWIEYVEKKISVETKENRAITEERNRIIKEERELAESIQKRKDRLNRFLYYEIYDAFLRKYGYEYVRKSYTTTTARRVEVSDSPLASSSDYDNFYYRYKEYLTGEKAPDSSFIQAKQRLEARDVKVNIIEPREETHYYIALQAKTSEQQKIKEVENVYKTKKDKVQPKAYSVVQTVGYYKKLTFTDIKMICEHLQKRLGADIFTDSNIKYVYYIYEHQPEKFREYASVLDEKYSSLYP